MGAPARPARVGPSWVHHEDLRLHEALRGLRPEHRAGLLLTVVDGYTQAEVAAMLEVAPGTVASWVSRSKAQLRVLAQLDRGEIGVEHRVDHRRGEIYAGGWIDAGAGPEGFVIVADRMIGDLRRPLVLASGNGRDWIAAPEQPAFPADTVIMQVAPIVPDWVAAGVRPSGDELSRGITVWHSANGLDWEIATEIASDTGSEMWPGTYAPELVSLGDSLLLSEAWAVEGTDTRPIETWRSRDGRSWELLGLPSETEVRAALPRGDGARLGGRIGVEAGRATIWSWQVQD